MLRVTNVNAHIIQKAAAKLESSTIAKFPKINHWINGEAFPTLNQLIKLAKASHFPLGYFFLEEIPIKEIKIPHYRTNANTPYKASDNLKDTIQIIQKRQYWARDILIEWGNKPLKFAGKFSIESDLQEVVDTLRFILDLNQYWAKDLHNWREALKLLIQKTEEAGIFVVMNGVVDSNTHRKLDVEEFRGFVLYDEIAPFVFINGADSVSGKIFTIVHELVHVLVGHSASFDLKKFIASDNDIEQFCDRVTAEFLVPKDALLAQINIFDIKGLARYFKVSEIVIARRLLDLGELSKKQFLHFYWDYTKRLEEFKKEKNTKGGNFYNTVPYRISKRFFKLVNTALKSEKILYREAFKLTGLTSRTYDKYLEKHGNV